MGGNQKNDFPLYKSAEEGHYIFREKSGKWMVAEERAHVDSNAGWIESQSKAVLPTTSGLTWTFYDGNNWVPDGGISVTADAATMAPSAELTVLKSDDVESGGATGAEYKNIVLTLMMVIDRQP